jgi:MFS family permease
VTAAVFAVTTAVNLQVPLYTAYAERAGLGRALAAAAFAAYVAGLVPVLLLLGGISDRAGRKPVLLAALACSTAATVAMAVLPEVRTLFAARALQGIGVGLCMGAAAAYLAELYPTRLARIPVMVALASALGFGAGPLLTTLALLPGPTLRPGSFVLGLALLAAAALAVAVAAPALAPRGGPLLRVPAYPPGTRRAGAAIFVAWAVSGLVIGVVPAALRERGLGLWAGPALFMVNFAGALSQRRARRMDAAAALRAGCLLLPPGYLLIVWGAAGGGVPALLAGAALAGAAGYGLTYLGGLRMVVAASGREEARGVAGYFLLAYLGFGVPAVGVGALADRIGTVPALGAFAVPVLAGSAALAFALRAPAPAEPA